MNGNDLRTVEAVARQLRVDSIRASTSAGSGHPTSSLSAADLMAVLLVGHLRYDWQTPHLATNDHLIFSKGHASPLLYSMFRAAGVVSEEELLDTYRRFGARLEGHPTPILPWVDVATGSLGQGLPDAIGVCLAGKFLDKLPYRAWVLCGDSELAEGSVWEAFDKAGHYGLSNLTAIVDVNRLGQRGPTELEWDLGAYAERVEAFGCAPIAVDGHDYAQVDEAFAKSRTAEQPSVILARTIKGKGVPDVENKNGWHGRPLPKDLAEASVKALGGVSDIRVVSPKPDLGEPALKAKPRTAVKLPAYDVGASVATRAAFGDAIAALVARPEVVVLDGEVGNSTGAEKAQAARPDAYFQMWIAEQQLVAAAVGLAVRGYIPFATTFAAFFSRAFDFIRMAGISAAPVKLVGSHAGCEIGADGPSQMALEDLASLRAVNGSVLLYPSDATSAAKLTEVMADIDSIVYLRTTRGSYPVLYPATEGFEVGGSKLIGAGPDDKVALIGAGVTLHECLKAADSLREEGVPAQVIDLYSVKPVDTERLVAACETTGGRLVVAEDHYPEGGIGSAVLEALSRAGVTDLHLEHLAVRGLPCSGTSAELLDNAGISAPHIAEAARRLASS